MIVIETKMQGNQGLAICTVGEKSYTEYGRTIANALSNIVSRLARQKDLQGEKWITHDRQVKGVIGDKIKKKRSTRVSDLPRFEMHGGSMRDA